jgi:hypothetical protein
MHMSGAPSSTRHSPEAEALTTRQPFASPPLISPGAGPIVPDQAFNFESNRFHASFPDRSRTTTASFVEPVHTHSTYFDVASGENPSFQLPSSISTTPAHSRRTIKMCLPPNPQTSTTTPAARSDSRHLLAQTQILGALKLHSSGILC